MTTDGPARRRRVLSHDPNSDADKRPPSKPERTKRGVSEQSGRNSTARNEQIYKHIETVVYEAEQKRTKPRLQKNDKGEVCAQCTFGKVLGSKSGVEHEGDEWIPIRNFKPRLVKITDVGIAYHTRAPTGLQNNCDVCNKDRRVWRGDEGEKLFNKIIKKAEESAGRELSEEEKKSASDAWATKTYGSENPCSFNGGKCLNPNGPNLPWSAFGLSIRQDPMMIHHNICNFCSKSSSSEGDRWVKYSPDGRHSPNKILGVTTCSQDGCDITVLLENDHCVELNFGGSDNEANQQYLHKKHHDEKKGTIGPNIKSVHEVTKDMVSERFHPVLDKAKEENWSLDKLVSQLKIAMEQFLRWKVSLTDAELNAFFTSQNARNNTQHDEERAVRKFRKWCSNSPHRWNPEHKDYAKRVSGLEVKLEFTIDGP